MFITNLLMVKKCNKKNCYGVKRRKIITDENGCKNVTNPD